jgi:hypothetical protein
VGRPHKVVGDRRSKKLGRREEREKSPKAREKITVAAGFFYENLIVIPAPIPASYSSKLST